jgi:cytochrome P450
MTNISAEMLPALLQDPHPFLRALQLSAPINFIADFNVWLVTGYKEVEAVLLNLDGKFSVEYSRFTDRPNDKPPTPSQARTLAGLEHLLMHMEPPEHTHLRKLARAAITRSNISALAPQVERTVDQLLDVAEQKGEIDFVADFAAPIPIFVMAHFLGVPLEDAADFRRWSDDALMRLDVSKPPEIRERALTGLTELHEYFERLLAKRAVDPRDDIISALASVRVDGEKLTDDQAFGVFVSLMLAGTETTRHLISNSVVVLQRHPDQRKLVTDDPTLIPKAIEEILRYDGPIAMSAARTPYEDMEFAGASIRAGQRVVPSLSAANRDPDVFSEPDTFNIMRSEKDGRGRRLDHIAFGGGAHHCIGKALAQLEAHYALKGLIARFPKFEAHVDGPLDYQPTFFIRGLNSLKVRVAA